MRQLMIVLGLAMALNGPVSWLISYPAWAEETYARGVPYLTLRNRSSDTDRERFYGNDRGALGAGHCDIRELPLSFLSSVAEATPFYVHEGMLRVAAVRPAPPEEVLETLEHSASDRKPVLYTHGFFIDFEKGCRRATVLQESASLEERFLWFSWPSDGSLFNYTRDEADLAWSVLGLAEVIIDLEQRFGSGQVNLMGHSLGGRGIMMAIYDVAAQRPDIRLGDVILLAPDMDFDIFAAVLPRIRKVVSSITIYVAEADRPLALSEQVHGHSRLGQTGNDFRKLSGAEVIDVSDLQIRSPTGHLYHVYNQEVGGDIDQILNEGLRPEARRHLVRHGENLWRLQRPP